jgi:flagellar biosynthetic protein FliR
MDMAEIFGPVLQIAMIMVRVGAFWAIFPFVMQVPIPASVRISSALTLAIALRPLVIPTLPVWNISAPPGLAEVVYFAAREMVLGVGLGITARWIFASCIASAEWLGSQIGFAQGNLMNPDFEQGESSWSAFHAWLGMMVYFSIGGHWLTIRALAESYRFNFTDVFVRLSDPVAGTAFWIEIGTEFFAWMLRLAGPMVVVVLLLQAAMGVLSKFIPQINIWSVSLPITIGVGVFVFSLLSPMYGDALVRLFADGTEAQFLFLKYMGAR